LKSNHVARFANFIYDTTSNNKDFPPEWPSIDYGSSLESSEVSEIDDALSSALLQLVEETSQRRSRLAVLASNDHQTLAQEAQDNDDQQTGDHEGDNDEDNRTTDNMSLNSVPSTSASTSTMGVSNLQIGTVPTTSPQPTIAISTSTITRHPHLFLPVMYAILGDLEAMNTTDAELPLMNHEVNRNWTYHKLSAIPEWKYLNRRQRSKLVFGLTKSINGQTPFDGSRLPSILGPERCQFLESLVTATQQQVTDGTFESPVYLALKQLRTFSILPVPSLRRTFIQVSHNSLAEIMRFCGLGKYAVTSAGISNVLHENFKIFNMKKIKKGYVKTFRGSRVGITLFFNSRGVFENQFYTDGYSACFPFKKAVASSSGTPLQ
jgi:hypothetical protein